VLNAAFYLLQNGCQWRMLPRDFPPRSTVYGYFRAGMSSGVWARVHDVLYRRSRELEGRDESPTAAIIDSQSVKTGAEARKMVGVDAGKRVKGRKRHLVTDTLGLMLGVEVHSAGVQDRDGATLVLDCITRRFPFIERIFADAGYQGPRVAEAAPRPVEIIKRTDAGFVCSPSAGSSSAPSLGPASTAASPRRRARRNHRPHFLPDRHDQADVPADRSLQGLLSQMGSSAGPLAPPPAGPRRCRRSARRRRRERLLKPAE
jgi:transposase